MVVILTLVNEHKNSEDGCVPQHVNRLLSKIKLFYMKCMKMKNEFLWSLGIFFSFNKEIFYTEPRPWDGVAMK